MSFYCFGFLPCKSAAEAIRAIIHNCSNHFWKTYGDVDKSEKEHWFRLFEVTSNIYIIIFILFHMHNCYSILIFFNMLYCRVSVLGTPSIMI